MRILDLTRSQYFNNMCGPMDWSNAAGSAVAGVFNLISNRQNNRANAKLAAQQNEWNVEQWNREADFTREMWNATNEYNDPSAQMDRLTSAGLSPWAAAQVMGAGDATGVSTPASQGAVGYANEAMNFDFIGEAAQQAFRQYIEHRNFQADMEKKEKENALLDEQLAQQKIKTAVDQQFGLSLAQSQLDNSLLDQHNKRYGAALSLQQLGHNASMFQLAEEYQRRQNTMLDRTITEQEIKNDMLEIQKAAEDLKLKNLPAQLAAELAVDRANAFAAYQSGKLSIQQAKESFERTAKTKLEAAGVRHSNTLAKRLANYQVHEARSRAYAAENDRYGKYVGFGRGLGNYLRDLYDSARGRATANSAYRHDVWKQQFMDKLKYNAVYGHP